MARQTITRLIDDLDQSEADETVRFGLDGVQYEIDLSAKNAAKLRDLLQPYIAAGKRINRAGGRATFAELTAGCRHRIEVVVYFLALLELYKSGHVDLSQASNFGELVVTRDGDAPPWTPSAFSATVTDPDATAQDPA